MVFSTIIPLKLNLLIGICLYFFLIGFAIAYFMKYPKQRLKAFLYKILRKDPLPYVMITSDNYLKFDVAPKRKFIIIDGDNPEKTSGYIPAGDNVNIMGMGNGFVFFEEVNVPLKISANSLRNQLEQKIKEVDFNLISSRLMGDLWTSFTSLGYQTGLAKTQKRQTWIIYAILGITFITLGLAIAIYLQNKAMINVHKIILDMISNIQEIVKSLQEGAKYGIK